MTTYFVDSSALAKRYLAEVGSKWVLSWIEPAAGHVIILSELAYIEMQSLLARHLRGGTLPQTAAHALKADFLIHYRDEYLVVHIDTALIQSAGRLVNTHKLRALDAIQLACAVQAANILAETLTFISGDTNLLTAAAAQGFITDNPYQHP